VLQKAHFDQELRPQLKAAASQVHKNDELITAFILFFDFHQNESDFHFERQRTDPSK
jgi:hypothetical protein